MSLFVQNKSHLEVAGNRTNESIVHIQFDSQTARYIWVIGSPCLLTLGTVGSLSSLLVLTRQSLRYQTTMFYLTVLSVADLLVLYTGLLRHWLKNTFNDDIRVRSTVACRLHMFVVYFSFDFTAWLLVAVTFDRCLRVTVPFMSRNWCTLNKARLNVCIMAFVVIVVNLHFFWTEEINSGNECRTSKDFNDTIYEEYIWSWIDLWKTCIFPFSFIVICNSFIIKTIAVSTHNLKKSNKKVCVNGLGIDRNQRPPDSDTTCDVSSLQQTKQSQVLKDRPEETPGEADTDTSVLKNSQVESDLQNRKLPSPINLAQSHLQPTPSVSGCSRRDMSIHQIKSKPAPRSLAHRSCCCFGTRTTICHVPSTTAMLLVVNTLFCALRAPLAVFLISWESEDYPVAWAVVNMLHYTNNAAHFFVYCLVGRRLRHELTSILKAFIRRGMCPQSQVT